MAQPPVIPVQDPENGPPNTGQLLTQYIKAHRIRQSALGRALGYGYESIRGYKAQRTMLTDTLWNLCHALKHNFFADIAAKLPAEYSSDAPVDGRDKARIAELEKELELVKAERDVLVRVMGR